MTLSPNNNDRFWKEEKARGWLRFSSPPCYLVFLLTLVALVAGIWYFFTPARQSYNVKNLALIRADDAPYKVKAEDQSIPGIKHQDKVVEESDEDASSSIASIEELIEETPEEKPAPPSRSKQQNILIQLGSLKSHDLAQEEWKRLSHKNKDLLGELEPTIQKVDLGAEKGIFYRLRTGVEDQKQAKQICSTLKERKVDCLVVH